MLRGNQSNGHLNRSRGNLQPRQIAFIGNYLPRQCGIATFTTDLCQAVATKYPEASKP